MKSEPTPDRLDRIKAAIRTEADAARERAPLPARASNVPDASAPPAAVALGELARPEGPAFVEHAYRTLLRRAPDTEGFARQMAVLGSGATKIEVLGDLRYSEEGRRHGVRVPGLFPRYLLAKLARLPLAGALVQWLIAFAALPHILRHQRATEASLAVRFGETAAALRDAERRDTELREAIEATRSDLAEAVAELSDRLTRSELRADSLHQHVLELRQHVLELRQLALTMNHWTVQVRRSIDAIEAAEAEQRARDDEIAAAIVMQARARDAQRPARLEAFATALAQRIPQRASLLDIASGADWLAAVAARGTSASAIESNAALHRDARALGLDVTLGDPRALLARVADASLDALTALSPDRFGVELPLPGLLHAARRVLKPGGCIVVGAATDAADETANALLAAGFADQKPLAAFGGALCAERP